MDDLAVLTDDELADQLTTWAGRVAAGEARLLALVAELDRRGAWAGPGMLSCAHWLAWRLGMGLVAARERVRVARTLRDLPLVAAALAAGRLSFSQVRAITRVAGPDDQQAWLDAARHATGSQLERLARGVRRAQASLQDEADPEAVAFRFRTRTRYAEDGTLHINIRASAADGAVLLAALEQSRSLLQTERAATPVPTAPAGASTPPAPAGATITPATARGQDDPERPPQPRVRVSLTDALLHLARTALEGRASGHPDLARRQRRLLTAQVDPLSGWARLPDGELLPPGTLQTPRPARLRMLTAGDLTRHDEGRRCRRPSLALRELLSTLDGERCRMPGCTNHRDLHAHHLRRWSRGGRTDLANLVLLCSRHRTLVSDRGDRLVLGADRTLTVTTAADTPVPHHPAQPWRDRVQLDPDGAVAPHTLPPHTSGQRLDLGYAVSVLLRQAA